MFYDKVKPQRLFQLKRTDFCFSSDGKLILKNASDEKLIFQKLIKNIDKFSSFPSVAHALALGFRLTQS